MSSTAGGVENLVIRASAGTGKTFQLTNRYIRLVAGGAKPESILATTFTRKGAGEILDRILFRLAKASCDPKQRAQLAKHVGGKWTAARCRELLHTLVRQWHALRVGTLDSFFVQIARSFALELGLPPGWEVADELADGQLRQQAIEDLLQQESTADAVRLMNLLSRGEATQTVSEEIGTLVDKLYDIYVESPPAAWRALRRRKLLSEEQLSEAIRTLEKASLPQGKRFAKAHEENVASARAGDWIRFLTRGPAAKIAQGETRFDRCEIPQSLIGAYQRLVDHARAVVANRIADQTEATFRLLERFDAAYQRQKAACGMLPFADITRRLARSRLILRPDELSYRIDAGVEHLLLDEFQDTNLMQWQVLQPLAEQVTSRRSGHSFFCVGDVKQAIFGWRGGVAEIFDAVHEKLKGLKTEGLNTSYRSAPPVIETVNRVFEGIGQNAVANKYPAAAKRWAGWFTKHSTARTDQPGYCRLVVAPRAEDSDEPKQDSVLRFAAREIQRLHDEANTATMGVLVRKNDSVARLIFELRRLGVDASEEGGNPLSDSPAVQVILSLLTLADHPGDSASLFHLTHSPLARPLGLALDLDPAAVAEVSRQIRGQLLSEGYGATIYRWVRHLHRHCDRRDFNRLMQLVEMAYAYEPSATLRADDFVELVCSQRVEDPTTARIRVMTFHKAKGLQFDIVVLPELDGSLAGQPPPLVAGRSSPSGPIDRVCRYVSQQERVVLPKRFQRMFDEEKDRRVEESLCVLYVGLTRPRYALHMIIAPSAANERNIPSTLAGVLRSALADGTLAEPGKVLYECGRADWYKQLAQSRPRAKAEPEQLALRLAPAGRRPRRGLELRSPSQLEGGLRVHLAHQLQLDPEHSRQRGTLIHAWLEQIEWLEQGTPDDQTLRGVAAQLGLVMDDLSEAMARFRSALRQPAVAALLSQKTYQQPAGGAADSAVHMRPGVAHPRWEVFREFPLAVRLGKTIFNGQIDRLVVLRDGSQPVGADVVDFKTDDLPPGDQTALAERVEYYRPQLEAYRQAVAARFGLPAAHVSARLAFITPGVVISPGR